MARGDGARWNSLEGLEHMRQNGTWLRSAAFDRGAGKADRQGAKDAKVGGFVVPWARWMVRRGAPGGNPREMSSVNWDIRGHFGTSGGVDASSGVGEPQRRRDI